MENENKDSNVRVMSKSESASYEGITIDESSSNENSRKNYTNGGFHYDRNKSSGIHIKVFSWKDLLFGSTSTLTRIAIIAALIAILGFLIFAVLPIAIVIVGIGIVVYFVMQLLFN